MTEKDLIALKEKIGRAKEKLQRLEGRKESLMQQLKKDFNCDTVEAAESKVLLLQKKVEKLKKKVVDSLDKLSEKFPEYDSDED